MVLGTAWGLSNGATIALAVFLAFAFGYAFTFFPMLRSGMALRTAIGVTLADRHSLDYGHGDRGQRDHVGDPWCHDCRSPPDPVLGSAGRFAGDCRRGRIPAQPILDSARQGSRFGARCSRRALRRHR